MTSAELGWPREDPALWEELLADEARFLDLDRSERGVFEAR